MTKTWIGGGANLASDPDDWSPTGIPLNENAIISHGRMVIAGNTLAGSNNLEVQGSDVTLFVTGVGRNSSAEVRPIHVQSGSATIHVIASSAFFDLAVRPDASAAINLTAGSKWTGNFQINGNAHIHGSGTFIPANGFNVILAERGDHPQVAIDADIAAGSGIDDRGGLLEIGGSVAAGENIGLFGGELEIRHPHLFLGQVELGRGFVDLIGLAQADSYSFKNDMLSIYSSNSVIDTLAFNHFSDNVFGVAKTSTGVAIYTNGLQPPGSIQLHNRDL